MLLTLPFSPLSFHLIKSTLPSLGLPLGYNTEDVLDSLSMDTLNERHETELTIEWGGC